MLVLWRFLKQYRGCIFFRLLEMAKRFVVKDYIAIIGATAVIAGVTAYGLWGSFSTGDSAELSSASIQPVSVSASAVPEANNTSLQNKKPVITIEEIDPQDRKQSIKAKLEEAKVQDDKRAKAKKQALEHKASKAEKKKSRKADEMKKDDKKKSQKADEMKKDDKKKSQKADEMKKDDKKKDQTEKTDDGEDPGKIIFGSVLEPFATPKTTKTPKKDENKIPAPMELIYANTGLLTNIVNNTNGPAPHELHGTWEIMPCHSSVGVIAKRSFDTIGLPSGNGPYFEIVQYYSDPQQKVFGPQSETTIYVKLDEKHMLAAVNANTNLPKFSVLKKVSSEIEEEFKAEAPIIEEFIKEESMDDEMMDEEMMKDEAMKEEAIEEVTEKKKPMKKESMKKESTSKKKPAKKSQDKASAKKPEKKMKKLDPKKILSRQNRTT